MNDDRIVISWHRIAWQMVRHLCGPNRAVDHELARRYDKKMARVRAAWLREHANRPEAS